MKEATVKAFLESEIGRPGPDEALFHVLPVPMEKSVSYGTGTAAGPAAILAASQELELYDHGCDPAAAGIHTLPELRCHGSTADILHRIEQAVESIVDCSKIPVVLGGEHTVTVGAVRAVARRYPDIGIVHFDAHADLRQKYHGDPFSHACVIRRIVDMGLPVAQFGIRSQSLDEKKFRDAHPGIVCVTARELHQQGVADPVLPEKFPRRIYVTFDIDVLDPSLMPATGTPEPGGLYWWDTISLLESICRQKTVVGCDLVELAPVPGLHAPDFTAARLAYILMRLAGPNERQR